MPSALRSVAVLAFVSAVALLSAPACSEQGEGERCDFAKNGDLDCDSGLTCVKRNELAENVTDRCCPDANTETDSRCARGTPTTTTTGGSGNTSTAGAASGGEASGGAGVEATAGSPSGPASNDGGMSSGGTPDASDGGATPADASGGKGGAD